MRAPTIDLLAAAHQAMRENGLDPDFPPAVEREVAAMREVPAGGAATRGARDLRELLWSSVDNRGSRDLDQVEVAERLPDGSIRVLIGIADVDALVPKGSATDAHAAENTTSVYTGVAVFPMIPERLSTDLTSLNEGEDRLAVVIQMDVSPDGTASGFDAYRAVVRNRAKLAYEAVGAWLDGVGPLPAAAAAVPALEAQLRLQDEAARRLREFRRRSGALNLDTIEARPVVVDGRVIDVQAVERNRARDLIEDYMVTANTTVARFLLDRGVAAIRRVVTAPRRWDRVVALAAQMGETLPPEPDPVALRAFLARRREADPEHFPDLSLLVVKMLGAGEYILERRTDERRAGHFALAVADYVHSTAPNRRFPDLVTQRLVKHAARGDATPYTDDELEAIARHCTVQEDAAKKVERTMRKKAAAVWMAERVGEDFTAVVTGASPKGTYVRVLRPPVEGRVVRGERGLDVGDTVRVRLVAADPERGFIDFEVPSAPDIARKLERAARKRAAAERLRRRVGEAFEAEVTGVTPHGTWVRLLDGSGEGKVVRGHKSLAVGMRVPVTLVAADPVHGFIDFEYAPGVAPRKRERVARKKVEARRLRDRVGDRFEAEVTGVTANAVWVRLLAPEAGVEGRLVRGGHGVAVGDRVSVLLLSADPARGFIDFAREG